jgi:zinc protease
MAIVRRVCLATLAAALLLGRGGVPRATPLVAVPESREDERSASAASNTPEAPPVIAAAPLVAGPGSREAEGAASGSAIAPRAPSATPADSTTPQEWALDPGTTVVLIEDHRVPVVDVRIDFAAGSWSPWFVESHAGEAFTAQMDDAAGAFRHRAAVLGIEVVLRTGSMSSTLAFSCLREDLAPALDLVREILTGSRIDRRELARRRRASSIEWQASLKEPGFRLEQAFGRSLFRGGDARRRRYEKPPRPSTDVGRLIAARDTLVRLNGRVIGFAGDMDRADAARLASGLLPAIDDGRAPPPAGLAPALLPLVAPPDRPRRTTVALPRLTQAYFGVCRGSLSFSDPGYPASLIADAVLGGGFYSRLNVALRIAGGDSYGAETNVTGGVYAGLWSSTSYTRAANGAAAQAKLTDALQRFRAGGITEDERAAAAGHLLGELALGRQSPRQILDERLWEIRWGLPRGFNEAMARRAGALTLDEVNGFIRGFYDPALLTTVEVVPR